MNGPEHYRIAEALLRYQENLAGADTDEHGVRVPMYETAVNTGNGPENQSQNALSAAQVHAELAHTAALVDIAHSRGDLSGKRTGAAWIEAVS